MREYKRYLAIDDSFFEKPGKCIIVEVVWESRIVGIGIHKLWTDPGNLTEFIRSLVLRGRAEVVFTDGITICGFGMWNPGEVEVPTITIVKKIPKLLNARNVILRLHGSDMVHVAEDFMKKLELVEIGSRRFYIARYNIRRSEAIEILKRTCKYSYFPEPLRLADVIARELGSRFIKGILRIHNGSPP